ncbi:MAG: hypothetical protein IT424_01510 [Pirellulales bacterium]|nr:hypothetical protein [Pirellulales bacterium]
MPVPRVARCVMTGLSIALPLVAAAAISRADQFHGLNAGAPVWNGAIQLTPEKAALFAATGTKAIRVNFRLDGAAAWGAPQLNAYDQIIQNAAGAGLTVLGLLSNESVAGGQTLWNDDPDGDGRNAYVASFADAALLLVDRYKNDVKQWEVWNEPNAWTNPGYQSNPQQAGGTYILPRVYAELLSQTYRKLNVGPNSLLDDHGVKLASGGLLAHDIGGSFSTAMDYMQQVYSRTGVWNSLQADAGRRYPWDDFGYHFYISQGSLFSQTQLNNYFTAVRNTQSTNGDPSPILVTEFGWQTVGTNTEELQRQNMASAYDYLESRDYVSGTYWYQWTDDATGAWGLVHGDNAPKLAYHEFVRRNQPPGGNADVTTEHAPNDQSLSLAFSSHDLLAGLVAEELPGDLGWHSANPAHADSLNPHGLPAFTDGAGDLGSGVTGLLNDFPASGAPAKRLQYDLTALANIDEIRIFTGNNGADGRIFSTTAVWTSTDGAAFELLGYYQSDPSGTINVPAAPGGGNQSTVVRIARSDASPLAAAVRSIRFEFFAVADLSGVMRDPFDGVNAFTGADDGLPRAYVSPLVREIDLLGTLASPSADFNADGSVDGADFLRWQQHYGAPGDMSTGDADGDGLITAADLAVWTDRFGTAAAISVPEGQSWIAAIAAWSTVLLTSRRAPPHR